MERALSLLELTPPPPGPPPPGRGRQHQGPRAMAAGSANISFSSRRLSQLPGSSSVASRQPWATSLSPSSSHTRPGPGPWAPVTAAPQNPGWILRRLQCPDCAALSPAATAEPPHTGAAGRRALISFQSRLGHVNSFRCNRHLLFAKLHCSRVKGFKNYPPKVSGDSHPQTRWTKFPSC